MLVFAILFDILSLVPILNIFTLFMGQSLFAAVFWLNGVKILEKKKLLTFVSASIVEVAPIISWLPGITLGVIIVTAISRTEDRLKTTQ